MLQNIVQEALSSDNCPIFSFHYYGALEYKASNTLPLSSEIINGEKAIESAKGFLTKAGFGYYFIDGLAKDDRTQNWIPLTIFTGIFMSLLQMNSISLNSMIMQNICSGF